MTGRIDKERPDGLLPDPELSETQQLLLGVDVPEGEYDIDSILAEYRDYTPAPKPEPKPDPKPEPGPVPAPRPEGHHAPKRAPSPEPEQEPKPGPLPGPKPEPKPKAGPKQKKQRPKAVPKVETKPEKPRREPEPPPAAREGPAVPGAEAEGARRKTEPKLEDVVASTVDEVKAEQDVQQKKFRRRLIRRRKKAARILPGQPPPEDEGPPPIEAANWHRRRYRECRRGLRLSAPVLLLLWLPWVLAQMGVSIPFFSENSDNASICILIPQAAICLLCWPVFRAAWEGLRSGEWDICTSAALCSVVTLLDEMTLLLLPGRSDTVPLGGAASTLAFFALWGLTNYHRGFGESFRVAAMGVPTRVAGVSDFGVARGSGSGRGYYSAAMMEDTSSQWQRLLLPVLAAASAVFAVLSTVGQGRAQNLLWCWSVILCASSPLAFPLAFCVPFGRIAARMARCGSAAAGHFGALALSSSRQAVVTDLDLFPPGSVSIGGQKLYGEESHEALAYAASLAAGSGGILGRLFSDACRREDVPLPAVEHFHIHDGGFGGMIHGQTVLLGTPAFMRHQAVRLPAALPYKTSVCLAVDGQLQAIFGLKYTAADTVLSAVRMAQRSGVRFALAVRDGNISPRLVKSVFGFGGASALDRDDRVALSDPDRPAEGCCGLLYREGLVPLVTLVSGSIRLCQLTRIGDLLSVSAGVAGALLGLYLTFTGSYSVLTPLLILTYMLLWTVPMLPLVWSADKL